MVTKQTHSEKKRIACAAVKKRRIDTEAVKLFTDIASSDWNTDPEYWNNLEWEARTRVLGAAADKRRDRGEVAEMAALLLKMAKKKHLERWFA